METYIQDLFTQNRWKPSTKFDYGQGWWYIWYFWEASLKGFSNYDKYHTIRGMEWIENIINTLSVSNQKWTLTKAWYL